jgi:hypothetical protein
MQQRRSEEPVPIVPLNRRFVEWNEKEPTDPEFRQAMGLGEGGVGWDELLEKRRVVILAEAGSGKSTEMAERARLTAAGGRFAFHATVAEVGRDGLEDALSSAGRTALAAWKASAAMVGSSLIRSIKRNQVGFGLRGSFVHSSHTEPDSRGCKPKRPLDH